jgi:gas vesicle protein
MSLPKNIASIGLLAGFIQVAAIGLLLAPDVSVAHGGGDDSNVSLVKLRESIKRAQEERERLEAELIAGIEREASEVLARISRANEPEQLEPVVIKIPESIEPEQVAQIEPLAPVNDLVAANVQNSPVSIQVSDDVQSNAILSDNDTIALLLILAEID